MDINDLKKMVGKRFYWDEHSNRYVITRTGILDEPYRGQICFDGSHDYKPPSAYRDLRTTYEKR